MLGLLILLVGWSDCLVAICCVGAALFVLLSLSLIPPGSGVSVCERERERERDKELHERENGLQRRLLTLSRGTTTFFRGHFLRASLTYY